MKNIDKKKLGIVIYYTSLVIAVILLTFSLFFVKDEDENKQTFIRYIYCFYCFGGLISIGMICREYLVEEYNKKKMIIKVIITSLVLIIGTLLLILIPIKEVGLGVFIGGIAELMYVVTPTKNEIKK